MILYNPSLFQSKLAAQEIFELRKANEMEYHEQRMTNLAELHSAQMEVVALEKEYFQKKIALLNSKLYFEYYNILPYYLSLCIYRTFG